MARATTLCGVSISAGIVSFNPPESMRDLCGALLSQGCPVTVVDNGSGSGADVLDDCERAGADVVRLGHNAGVSGALTVLVDMLSDKKWLLTLDEDSRPTQDFVALLTSSPALTKPRVAVVGPMVRDEHSGHLLQGDAEAAGAYHVPGVITSGSLCRTDALREVGGVRSDLFIDDVVLQICACACAFRPVVIEPAALLMHSIGAAAFTGSPEE